MRAQVSGDAAAFESILEGESVAHVPTRGTAKTACRVQIAPSL